MHTEVDKRLKSRALIMHCLEGSSLIDLTVHPIHYTGNEQVVGSGTLMGEEEKAEIVSILSQRSDDDVLTLRNPRVLAKTPWALVWWMPRQQRDVAFKTSEGFETFKLTFPTTIGAYARGRLYFVTTRTGKDRLPNKDTLLYNLPMGNLFSGGSTFCGGNISQLPTGAQEANIPQWEQYAFDTLNTHGGGAAPIQDAKGNPIRGYKELIEFYRKYNGKAFPLKHLVPLGGKQTTLGEFLAELNKKGGRHE